MNQLVPLQAPLLVPQEQIQALMVQAQWISSILTGIAIAGGVFVLLPKIVGAVREKK